METRIALRAQKSQRRRQQNLATKFGEGKVCQNHQQKDRARSRKQHEVRNQERRERRRLRHPRSIMRSSTTRGARRRTHSREVLQRTSHKSRSAGLEQQSDQSTGEIQPSMSRVQSAFENKQWQARRMRFQQPRWRSGRQSISFRSCAEDSEHTDQKAAQVASAPPGPLFCAALRSHRGTSSGEVSLLLRSHVACVSKPSRNKKNRSLSLFKQQSPKHHGSHPFTSICICFITEPFPGPEQPPNLPRERYRAHSKHFSKVLRALPRHMNKGLLQCAVVRGFAGPQFSRMPSLGLDGLGFRFCASACLFL